MNDVAKDSRLYEDDGVSDFEKDNRHFQGKGGGGRGVISEGIR